MSVFDAGQAYAAEGVPLLVIAGKEYGSGSSRDWAAKGPALLGVRFVLAESFERIHRSNLVGMGILPIRFDEGDSAESLGLTGEEKFAVRGLASGLTSRMDVTIEAIAEDGAARSFHATVLIEGQAEIDCLRAGGILPMVIEDLTA